MKYSEKTDQIIIHGDMAKKFLAMQQEANKAFFMPQQPAPEPKVIIIPYPSAPCPFCGGTDTKQQAHTTYGHGDSTCEVFVQCNTCKGRGPDTGYWGTPTDEQKLKAVELWNQRK